MCSEVGEDSDTQDREVLLGKQEIFLVQSRLSSDAMA